MRRGGRSQPELHQARELEERAKERARLAESVRTADAALQDAEVLPAIL